MLKALSEVKFEGPKGVIQLTTDRHAAMPIYIAEANTKGGYQGGRVARHSTAAKQCSPNRPSACRNNRPSRRQPPLRSRPDPGRRSLTRLGPATTGHSHDRPLVEYRDDRQRFLTVSLGLLLVLSVMGVVNLGARSLHDDRRLCVSDGVGQRLDLAGRFCSRRLWASSPGCLSSICWSAACTAGHSTLSSRHGVCHRDHPGDLRQFRPLGPFRRRDRVGRPCSSSPASYYSQYRLSLSLSL